MVAHAWFLFSCLSVALLPRSSAELSAAERYLYAQLEDALVNDAATLEQLREAFFQEPPRPNEIHFGNVSITSDSTSTSYCGERTSRCKGAFCPVTSNNNISTQGKLFSISATWQGPAADSQAALHLMQVLARSTVVPWCTHGPSLVFLMTINVFDQLGGRRFDYLIDTYSYVDEPIKLSVKLDCQPYEYQLIGAVGELFSWIEAYTEAGGKPLTWDPQQQGYAHVHTNKNSSDWGAYWLEENTFDWHSTVDILSVCASVECLLLKLSLPLLIPRLFLGYHNKIVHTITSPGPRSLYWGTAVVSLFLVIMIMLGKLIYYSSFFAFYFFPLFSVPFNFIAEITIPIVFLVISVIVSRKSRAVPMPAATFTTHVLFCCCCCYCCSPQHKSKGVQALALWAFMTFIYYCITEAVALLFTLFISVPLTVSCALMYVSGVFFAIMLLSIILFSCQSTDRSRSKPYLTAVDVCATILIISMVMNVLYFGAFIIPPLFSHLKVEGLESVSLKFSVFPSLALSVAGWLIGRKLLKEDTHTVQPDNLTEHGTTGHSLNDTEMEIEEEQSPEEQQRLPV